MNPNQDTTQSILTSSTGFNGVSNVADPVNPISGNFVLPELDLAFSGRAGMALRRVYNSLNPWVNRFGRGWNSPFLAYLLDHGSYVDFYNGDGARSTFQFDATSGNYLATEGCALELGKATASDGAEIWHLANRTAGVTWSFNSDGLLLTMGRTADGPADAILTYDETKHLQRVTNAAGQWFAFAYDSDGFITTVTDSSARTIHFAYDADGRLISVERPLGQITRYEYDQDGFLTKVTKPGDMVTTVTYADQRAVSVTNPDGQATTFAWNLPNRTVTVQEPNGVQHLYRFNEGWKLTGQETQEGSDPAVVQSVIGSGAFIAGIDDGAGGITSYTYGPGNNLSAVTDPAGRVTSYDWDPVIKRPARITDHIGREWLHTWDAAGNLLQRQGPGSQTDVYTHDQYGNILTHTDSMGRLTEYRHDPAGNHLLETIAPNGEATRYAYDSRGNLTEATDPASHTTTFAYDLLDRLVLTTFPDGRTLAIEYDAAGNVAVRRDNLNRENRYRYNGNGFLVETTHPDGSKTTLTRDPSSRVIGITDAVGRTTTFGYRSNSGEGDEAMPAVITYPDGSIRTLTYDGARRVVSSVDELGQTTVYEHDPSGLLTATVDPLGGRWTFRYDGARRIIAAVDPLNREKVYEYDPQDRIAAITLADGATHRFEYDAAGNRTGYRDPLGSLWQWQYDSLDRVTQAVKPDGATMTLAYGPDGNVSTVMDAFGRVTAFSYDAGGRQTAVTDPLGQVARNTYDGAGRLVATINPAGEVSTLTWDIRDRLTAVVDPMGRTTTFEFDPVGRLVATNDALGRRSLRSYDQRDRLLTEVDPEGHRVTFGYDAAGRQVQRLDEANRVWRWEYDALGRQTAAIDPLGNARHNLFNAVGNLTALTNARGQTIVYEYDQADRLSKITSPDGAVATIAYDLAGREISTSGPTGSVTKTYDALGNQTAEMFGPWGKGWQYQFDLLGNRTRATGPEGEIHQYGYDQLNRLTRLDPNGYNNEVGFAFDPVGRLLSENRTGVKTKQTFDPVGQLLTVTHDRTSGRDRTIAARQYRYDLVGNPAAMVNEDGETTAYRYNGADWLTKVIYPDGQQVSYQYSDAGDRLKEIIETPTVKGHGRKAVIGTDTKAVDYRYDGAGRMIGRGTDTFTYDADGNIVSAVESGEETRYTWTADNRLRRIEKEIACRKHWRKGCGRCPKVFTVIGEFEYLPNDWRAVTRKVDGLTFASLFDGADESHEYLVTPKALQKEWRFGPFCWKPKLPKLILFREFLGGPGANDLEATRYHGRHLWHLKDALGSTIALANRGGHPVARIGYDAWGSFRWPDKPGHGIAPCGEHDLGDLLDRFDLGRAFGFQHNGYHFGRHFGRVLTPYLFAGTRFDPLTQFGNNRNRFYAPRWGRFASSDPIGFLGGSNRYAYVRNNPLRYLDPYGLSTKQLDYQADPNFVETLTKIERESKDLATTLGIIAMMAFTSPEAIAIAAGERMALRLCIVAMLTGGKAGLNAPIPSIPRMLTEGQTFEADVLASQNLSKNTGVWRPTDAQIKSAAFKIIVGEPRYTSTGLPQGTILDSVQGGALEIKGGTSALNSSYQLRLQTFRALVENDPLNIQTTRPINPTFEQWLNRWGVTVRPPPN